MFKNYLKIIYRNLKQSKLYAFITILSLSIGLTACFLVAGHIFYELSFEECHKNYDRIYRLQMTYKSEDNVKRTAKTSAHFADALRRNVPQIEATTAFQVIDLETITVNDVRYQLVQKNSLYQNAIKLLAADPAFAQIFTVPFYMGSSAALGQPNSIAISRSAAQRYFGSENPIGESITLNDHITCQVNAIFQDIPENTQLHSDFIMSRLTLVSSSEQTASTIMLNDYVYALLKAPALPGTLHEAMQKSLSTYISREKFPEYSFSLVSLKDTYFENSFSLTGALQPQADPDMTRRIAMLAIFILIISIANFVNLTTARSTERIREIGMRKVLGAPRRTLVAQFIGESILMSILAMIVAIGLYEVIKKATINLLPRDMLFNVYDNPLLILFFLAIVLVTGIIGGLYPAFILSNYDPKAIFQKTAVLKSSRSLLRKGLVIFQFTLAVFFIFSTIVAVRQTRLITRMDAGFDANNIFVIDINDQNANRYAQLLKNEMAREGFGALCLMNSPLGRSSNVSFGFYSSDDHQPENLIFTKRYSCDQHVLSTFGLELVRGFDFGSTVNEISNPVIINRALMNKLALDNPIYYPLDIGKETWHIVGVVEDFHATPVNLSYHPFVILEWEPEACTSLILKYDQSNRDNLLATADKVSKRVMPGISYTTSFLSDEVQRSYEPLFLQGQLLFTFSFVILLVACMGILGLVAYAAQRRSAEMSVRKVLGASTANLIFALSKEFLLLIAIACFIGWPLAFLFMDGFLRSFPYQISIGFGTFIMTGLITIVLALATSASIAYKTVTADPVEKLRYE